MKRTAISKRLRFEIFARDGFTCRYCGKQSDQVVLHIDHIIPVCQDGTNDPENLITSCVDCNLGKSGKRIDQHLPNETDRLRSAQEMAEQRISASEALKSVKARAKRKRALVKFWCENTGRGDVDSATISTIFRYVQELGEDVVYTWIETASIKCYSDQKMGRYISGIRRAVMSEQAETQEP